jgi:hypothetical protein
MAKFSGPNFHFICFLTTVEYIPIPDKQWLQQMLSLQTDLLVTETKSVRYHNHVLNIYGIYILKMRDPSNFKN